MTASTATDAARLRALLAAPDPDRGIERRGGPLPGALAERHEGDLVIGLRPDRPTFIANFVSTLDGVVAFDTDETSGGGEVSGFFEPDRFMMALLRAMADVVVVGAGTVRAAPDHLWTAARVQPAAAAELALWRAHLGLHAPNPTTVVVTASGALPVTHPGLSNPSVPVVVVTTRSGEAEVTRSGFGPHLRTRVGPDPDRVTPADILDAVDALGARLALSEGGPHLLGELVGADLVDELFLTVAPQLAGRSGSNPRLGLVEGTGFDIASAPWANLRSVHAAGSHLFLRYALTGTREERS